MQTVSAYKRVGWKWGFSLVLGMLMIFMTACGNTATNSGSSASSQPVKIGVILSFTGTFAPLSESIKNGMELYFEQHNNSISNQKVEIKYEDDEGNPQVALRKYRQLVDSQKVDMLVGPISTPVLYALRDQIEKDKIVLIDANAAADDMSWDKKSDYVYRVSFSNWQNGSAGAKYFAEHVGKKAFVAGPDYPAGHENAEAFKAAFKAAGGTVVEEAYPKLGTNDFAAYMTQIAKANPDFVYAFATGTDGIRFVQQYKQFGLAGKVPLTGPLELGDELITGPAGDAAQGILAAVTYFPNLDNDVNKKFVQSYKAKYGKNPNVFSVQGYDSAQIIDAAIQKAGSKKSEDLIKVLKGISFDSPRGRITIDPKTNNPIQNMYIVKNVMKDGAIVQEVIETVKDVTMPEKAPDK
ncbi:ABC transporter substrate-binding protein [Effusibacillus dendaii]|uniref:ABC transporter substrate-binding protein n=1 Tax=Effusibacillus dendaii TaxID=2743772 RepID=A0A7I8DFX0_9BACL|nr:ABC transporter substrate-binding protein [Effusibacillus dendaii]BCJ88212.1 ABC transporter substrate-binding protein [Effusibacillus dendaii]